VSGLLHRRCRWPGLAQPEGTGVRWRQVSPVWRCTPYGVGDDVPPAVDATSASVLEGYNLAVGGRRAHASLVTPSGSTVGVPAPTAIPAHGRRATPGADYPSSAESGNVGNATHYRLPVTATWGVVMSSSEKIAHAYGVLVARGGTRSPCGRCRNRRGCGSAR
jgi:hypothetical protein